MTSRTSAFLAVLRLLGQTLLNVLFPHGCGVRCFVAGIGLIMGAGRLLHFWLSATIIFSETMILGGVLVLGSAVLIVTVPWRLHALGRLAASLAVGCFGFVGASTWGSLASLLYFYCLLACFFEASTRHNDGC